VDRVREIRIPDDLIIHIATEVELEGSVEERLCKTL